MDSDSDAGGFSSSVPSEIKARGRRATLAYKNALKTGKVKVYRARIMLIGQDRAGKTSLKKSLIGLPFDPNEQSTDGIDVDASKFDIHVDQAKNWQRTGERLDVSCFANDLARMVAEKLQAEENETQMDPELEKKTEEIQSKTIQIEPALPPKEFTDLLVHHLEGQTEAAADEHHMTLDLWDFAGQHLYYASHSVFLTSQALYMLVYDLSKDLRSTAQPCFRHEFHDIVLNNPNHETNLENLLSWMVSVSNMCSSKPESELTWKDLPYSRPPIFIVGTHADMPHQDIKEMEMQIMKETVGKDYGDHVIRPFFSVDNTQGSSDEGVAALQKRMIEVLKQEPYMGQDVPIRWFNFEKVVHALVDKKTYYLDLKQLQAIIQEVCYIESEDEAATMLNFYHDLGMIVKHRTTVVLQAQWLIEVFKQLITIPSFSDMGQRHSMLWKEMETTGFLRMELVDQVFSKFCHQDLIKEDILNMMEQFGLIVKFATSPTDEMYFVPCQLKTPPEPLHKIQPSPSDPCPLYLRFLGGFVPHGLFSQLVSRCTRQGSKVGFERPPQLYDGAARFFIGKELFHELILICNQRFIKIVLRQVHPYNEASVADIKQVASIVRYILKEVMQNLTDELPWLNNCRYEWCIACPHCQRETDICSIHRRVSCTHESCLHFLEVLDEGRLNHCQNTFSVETVTPTGLEKWFATKVPSDVKAHGPRAELAYVNALKSGKVTVYRARIMLIGQERVGKTSLKKSFLGMPFDPEEKSTDGIEVAQVKNWQHTEETFSTDQYVDDIARIAARLQEGKKIETKSKHETKGMNQSGLREEERTRIELKTQDKPAEKSQQNEGPIRNEEEEKVPKGSVSVYKKATRKPDPTSLPEEPELKIDLTSPPKEFADLFDQNLKGLNPHSDTTAVEHTLDLWDFGGQHVYYASYPVFLSPKAVYLLVYNLKNGLNLPIPIPADSRQNDPPGSNPTGKTNLENLLSWLVSVNTMCSSKAEVVKKEASKINLPYLRPPVFIVGTHADEPHQDIKEMESQIQKELTGQRIDDHVIRPYFAIENKQGSSCKGVAKLQERITEVLKQDPDMVEEVPLRWFNFEKVRRYLIDTKETHSMTLEELQPHILKVCEDKEDAAHMLDFYHDRGIIVKHRNTVVLDAQWLILLFKQLITIRPYKEREGYAESWKKMEDTGVLKMELVDQVFEKFGLLKEDILNMMEQFGLIVKFVILPTEEMYFVPCLLKTPPDALCKQEPSPSDPCPLYLQFHGGFVPHGFFPQLVSRYTRWCCESRFSLEPHLFDGAARFYIKKKLLYHLILVCKKRFIKFVLKQTQPSLEASFAEIEEVARLVRTFLEETMENLARELPWLSNLMHKLCVACPHCPPCQCSNHSQVSCTHEDSLCLLEIPEDRQLIHCRNSYCNELPTVHGMEKWFPTTAVCPFDHLGTEYVYNMTARPRGITLIINNKQFEHDILSTRDGSEEDVREVKALFDALGFVVHTKENLTKKQLLHELDSVACQNHSSYDCFVLWLMSHGESGVVFCSDGDTLPIQSAKDIIINCETLRGKPKLFFLPACRGYQQDEGVTMTESPSPKQHPPGHGTRHEDSRVLPTYSDFLCSYATLDGYVAYRNQYLGNYFVRALVEVFRERAQCDDLLSMLTTVNDKVSKLFKTFKQMPQFDCNLRKKLLF